MDRLDPNKIDDIFRESAELGEYHFQEAAWKDLEQRLDAKDRKRRVFFILWAFLGLGIITCIGYYNISHVESSSHDIDKDEIQYTKTNLTPIINAKETTNYANNEVSDEKAFVIDVNHQAEEVSQKTSSMTLRKAFNTTITKVSSSIGKVSRENKVTKINDNVYSATKPVSKTDSSVRAVETIPVIDRLYTDNLKSQKNLQKPTPNLTPMEVKKDSKHALSAYAGMSKVGTKLSTLTKTGYSYGVMYRYGITNHVEVSVGLGLTKQTYNCPGSVYQNDENWRAGIIPKTMDGEYIMTEIPISINYFFNNRTENGFVLSGQLSTYFINKEWYGFHYSDQDMQTFMARNIKPLMEVTEYNTQSVELVGRIGIGYQSKLFDKISLRVMPYIQVPITDVGIGKIQLYSGGVNLAITYHR